MKSAYYSRANSYSKSYNAIQAEREGRYPATAFKKQYGIDPRTVTTASEWHHSGKFANRVDYYDIEDVLQALADMPYAERKTKIKRGFKAFWDLNKKKYLVEKLGNKEVVNPNDHAPFVIYRVLYTGDLALKINDVSQWGRAIRKAIAQGIHHFKADVSISQSGSENYFHIKRATPPKLPAL